MLGNKKTPLKSDKTQAIRGHKRGVIGYSRKTALLEEAITQMNAGKYGRSSTALKELLSLDPQNMEARRLFATLHLRLGSLIPARQAFDSLISEAFQRQDYWLAESLLREYLAAGPRCVPFLEKLGTLYQEKGDALEAIAEYGKAIDILIEDPDPDNPHHPSQLYAKIRELSSASPIAIRLASFFDAQTGELLARPTSDSEQSTAPLSPDMSEKSQDVQAGPEPIDGMMSWEIPVTVPNVPAVDISDSSESAISPIITDLTAHQGQALNGEVAPSDPPVGEREPTTSSVSEVRDDAPEETLSHELDGTSSEAQIDDLSRRVILGDSHLIASPSESTERSEIPRRSDPAVSIPEAQEQDGLLGEAEPEALHEVSSPSAVSSPTELADTLEAPISSTQSVIPVSEPAAERSVFERAPDPAVPAAQEHDRFLGEAEPEVLHDVRNPSTVSLLTEPADMVETPISSAQPVTPLSEPAIEHSVLEREPNPAVSISVAQEQDRFLVEAEPEALHEVSSPSTVFLPTEPADMLEAPISAPQSIAPLSAMGAEDSGTQLGSDGSSGIQEHNRLLVEAEHSYDVVSASLGSAPAESFHVRESSSSVPSVTDAGVAPSFKIEEVSAEAFAERAPSKAEPVEPDDKLPSLHLPVEPDSKQSVTEQPPSTSVRAIQEPVAVSEMTEPWKQPGFSWESVFNSAWKFESDHSASTSTSQPTQTNVEEACTQVPTVLPHQEELVENHAVEIPERQESALLGDQTSSGSSIAPMPWDQVQESVISILPSQTDQSVAESTMSTIGQSAVETDVEWVPNVSESEAQRSSLPENSAAETDSFSIAQTPHMPISPELEISAADLGPNSSTTESMQESAESELQLPVVSSPTMDEVLPSETSQSTIASPIFQNRPVDDEVSPAEFSLRDADQVLGVEDEQGVVATQSTDQESAAEHPDAPLQPTDETVNGKTDEIPLSFPLLRQQQQSSKITEVPHPSMETAEGKAHEPFPSKNAPVEARNPAHEPVSEQEEWLKAGESIRFIEQSHPSPVAQTPPTISERQDVSRSKSVAAAAVDVLFESSRNVRATETSEPAAESKPRRKTSSALIRVRIAIASFASLCFSTTRAIVATCVGLVMLSGILIASGIGAIGLTWVIMEESTSPVFDNLTTTPQRTLSDFKKNGYFLLLGIDASADHDPIQVGYDRKPDVHGGNLARACFDSGSKTTDGSNASANVMRGWVRSSDPVGQFRSHQETIKGWGSRHQLALDRYDQWKKLPFEDWGYGQPVGPPCSAMVFAHQLHVADGFLHSADLGIDRLETDMEAWRIVLSQAKTLAVKMLALQAINDDVAVASGLLVRTDFDGKYLGRVTKFLRPLDQAELSMRWPMQSELVSASKTYESQLKAARAEEQPVYTTVASALPLPMQRRLNDYAEYYDASYKAAGEGQYGSLPKWKNYIHFPPSGLMDYLTNPIENIVGLEPLAPWDLYNGFAVDTEARLRLASLQAWLKRGPVDGDLLTRIAKAGQNFYDPYTGLPMLVNMKKGVLYSVGHDGKDQDADPQSDVVVEIPVAHSSSAQAKPSISSSKSR